MKDKKTLDPLLILFLGAAPALGATTDVRAALGMGCAALITMLLSGLVMSLLGKILPQSAKVPAAVLVTAGFVSLLQLLLAAFLPNVFQMLGVYLAVLAVNLLTFRQAEAPSLKESLLTGLCFTLLLFLTAAVREIFGSASFAGLSIDFLADYKIPVLVKAPGGLMIYAFVAALCLRLFPGRMALEGFAAQAAGDPQEGE